MNSALPETPDLADVFKAFPQAVRPLLEYHDILLRGDSPLTVAQRELIAAYVSGLNACAFCRGAHTIIAEAFGIAPSLIDALLNNPKEAEIDPTMIPLLRFIEMLTQSPAQIRPQHRKAVFDAGWSERALHDAVSVCALFNFMNRLVEGMGVTTSPMVQAAQRERHQSPKPPSNTPYMDYGRRLGIIQN